MNTYKFCREFEKIFERYRKDRIIRSQRIFIGGKSSISPPYSNFLYELSLYLEAPISEVKELFGRDCHYLHSMCEPVYRHFRKKFRKNCRKSGGLATYISGQNLHKCFCTY